MYSVLTELCLAVYCCGSCVVQSTKTPYSAKHGETYDFVIIGGGTAGLVVANRLSENPNHTVLVLEYGYLEDNLTINVPQTRNFYTVGAMQHDPTVRRLYYTFPTAPIEKLDDLTLPIGIGATVGGGSVVSGMLFNRGSRADYDAWRDLGNPGWGWDDLLPYFIKSSNFTPPKDAATTGRTWNSSVWGSSGPVHSSFPVWRWPQEEVFREAWTDLEHSILAVEDINDDSPIGVGWTPSTQNPDTQTRSSAKTAYYDPVAHRPNLKLVPGTKVLSITFEDRITTGVMIRDRSTTDAPSRHIKASREVVLAAGPIFSPNLLQISGVGPRHVLKEAKIPIVHDLPGVGMNLQDTPTIQWSWNLPGYKGPRWTDFLHNISLYSEAKQLYDSNRTGPLTVAIGDLVASLSLSQASVSALSMLQTIPTEDHLNYLPNVYTATSRHGYVAQLGVLQKQLASSQSGFYEFAFKGWSESFINLLQKPFSRGTVLLNTSDPNLGPLVQYNTLANPTDEIFVSAIVNLTRELFRSPRIFNEFQPEELRPGPNATSPRDVIQALSRHKMLMPSCSHESGGCSMMPLELGGVVGPDLKVFGVENLSVVDSSIIPLLPAARLLHTVYAIAEKASDIIKERHA